METIEQMELDAHRSQIIADVKRVVEKYRSIFDWDVPDINQGPPPEFIFKRSTL